MITPLIEKFLEVVDQATFQRLMDDVLFHEGHKFIGSPGTVIGKNKTSTGTPDSFYLDGDRYVFCEYTTQERLKNSDKFYKKLSRDIDHCFDVAKSHIPANKISKVVLGCTGKILPVEHDKLLKQIKQYNPVCELEVYTIQSLAFSIQRIPGLIDKYAPGIKTGHGAILTLQDFIAATTRGWQPALSNPFTGREKELSEALEKLAKADILVISGPQGTGKSKLGVHIVEQLVKQGYQARVIIHSPVQLWDHLHNYIDPGKRYVILVDDANKALPNLDYLLTFLQNLHAGQIKLILTVRNYKRNMLDSHLVDHLIEELIVDSLTEEQLIELVNESMPEDLKLTRESVDRITTVAKGNPRLALMAKDVLLKNDTLSALSSAEELYDEYFKQLVQEVSILKSTEKLRALGILAFYQVIDHSADQPKSILTSAFGIDWNTLWETYFSLEQQEIVDIFLSEVCKASDQVLSTYCFYKAFIDPSTAVLPFPDWIIENLDFYERRIHGAMNDLINTFGYRELRDRFNPMLNDISRKIADNSVRRYKFLSAFWYYRELEVLAYIEDWITSLDQQPTPDLNQSRQNTRPSFSNDYIELLMPFWQQSLPFSSEAMKLGLHLLYRQPSRCFDLLKIWGDSFSIHPEDDQLNFKRQHAFFNLLETDLATPDRKILAGWIIAGIAPQILEYEHTMVRPKGGRIMSLTTIHVVYNEDLVDLRKRVLSLAFAAYDIHPNLICEMLEKYVWDGLGFVPEIYREEIDIVSKFIDKNLRPDSLRHSAIVTTYLHTLEKHDLKVTIPLEKFTKSEKIALTKLLRFEYDDPDYKKVQDDKRHEMIAWLTGKDSLAIELVLDVVREQSTYGELYQLNNGLNFFLFVVAEHNRALFLHAISYMKNENFPSSIDVVNPIINVLRKNLVEPNEIYPLLREGNYDQKKRWLQAAFHGLNSNDLTIEHLVDLIDFIKSIEGNYYAYDLQDYDKFSGLIPAARDVPELSLLFEGHQNAVTLVCQLLFDRGVTNPIRFDHHFCQHCAKYFDGQLSLLKNIYIQQKNWQGTHYDYSGTEFEIISDLDNHFLLEYLKSTAKDQHNRRMDVDHLNVSCVWKYPEYEEIINEAIEFIIPVFPSWSSFEHTANFLFKSREKRDNEPKMLMYISSFIVRNAHRPEHLAVIMNVVAHTFPSKRQDFFIELIEQNKDLSLIKKISFEGRSVTVNSRVPVIDRDIALIKNIIDRIKGLPRPQRFLEIVQWYETKISYLQDDRARELKDDFRDSD